MCSWWLWGEIQRIAKIICSNSSLQFLWFLFIVLNTTSERKKKQQQYDKILKHLPISEHGFNCAPGWEFSSGKIPQNLHSSHSEILVTPGVNQDFVTDFSAGRVSPLNPNNWQPRKYLLVLKKKKKISIVSISYYSLLTCPLWVKSLF